MKETVVVFKKDAHATGFNVSRMRMFGFEADGGGLMGENWK
jgi:hypothetical protein